MLGQQMLSRLRFHFRQRLLNKCWPTTNVEEKILYQFYSPQTTQHLLSIDPTFVVATVHVQQKLVQHMLAVVANEATFVVEKTSVDVWHQNEER